MLGVLLILFWFFPVIMTLSNRKALEVKYVYTKLELCLL